MRVKYNAISNDTQGALLPHPRQEKIYKQEKPAAEKQRLYHLDDIRATHDTTKVFKQATKTALWGKAKSFNLPQNWKLILKKPPMPTKRELDPYQQEWKLTPDKANLFYGITSAVNLQEKKNFLPSIFFLYAGSWVTFFLL